MASRLECNASGTRYVRGDVTRFRDRLEFFFSIRIRPHARTHALIIYISGRPRDVSAAGQLAGAWQQPW